MQINVLFLNLYINKRLGIINYNNKELSTDNSVVQEGATNQPVFLSSTVVYNFLLTYRLTALINLLEPRDVWDPFYFAKILLLLFGIIDF